MPFNLNNPPREYLAQYGYWLGWLDGQHKAEQEADLAATAIANGTLNR